MKNLLEIRMAYSSHFSRSAWGEFTSTVKSNGKLQRQLSFGAFAIGLEPLHQIIGNFQRYAHTNNLALVQ